jgi:hypothetical protein
LNGMVESQIKAGVAVLSQPASRHQPVIRATSVDASFRARGNFRTVVARVGCCHLSGL